MTASHELDPFINVFNELRQRLLLYIDELDFKENSQSKLYTICCRIVLMS